MRLTEVEFERFVLEKVANACSFQRVKDNIQLIKMKALPFIVPSDFTSTENNGVMQ